MKIMIDIRGTWLGKELYKDLISIDDLLDKVLEIYDENDWLKKQINDKDTEINDKDNEIEYLKQEIRDMEIKKENDIEGHYADEYHEKKVLGMLDE